MAAICGILYINKGHLPGCPFSMQRKETGYEKFGRKGNETD